MPEETEKKEGSSLLDAWEKGKKLAVFTTMAAALLHSLYASYIKEEVEARAAFQTTTKSISEFSSQVDLQVATLQGRVDTLEKLVLMGHGDGAHAAEEEPVHDLLVGIPPGLSADDLALILEERLMDLEPAAGPPVMMVAPPDDMGPPEPRPVRKRKPRKKSAGLKYEAPRAPWEQRAQ